MTPLEALAAAVQEAAAALAPAAASEDGRSGADALAAITLERPRRPEFGGEAPASE